MMGFDSRFRDFPDYLRAAGREIWEGRTLGDGLAAFYHPAIIRRDARGVLQGTDALRASGLAEFYALPDRRLLTEDVIWSGSEKRGMLGSKRMVAVGRHIGDGPWGPASGARLRYRVMADHFAKAGRISDEWQVVDTAALLAQTGQDVKTWARARLDGPDTEEPVFCPEVDVQGPYTGRGNDDSWGLALEMVVGRLMTGHLSVVPDQYDPACSLAYPGGEVRHGHAAAERFWLGLRQSFPSASFAVHHRIGQETPMLPPRAALRWSLTGRHDGWGAFGRPTGAAVHVLGISHAEFGPDGLRREWTLYDSAAVWMQILASDG